MITFRPMSSLASRTLRVATVLLLLAGPVRAQSPLSHLEDAAPVPAGALRLRFANVWTRYDERFATVGGATSLGSELSADSLGVAQLPRLFPVGNRPRPPGARPPPEPPFGQP